MQLIANIQAISPCFAIDSIMIKLFHHALQLIANDKDNSEKPWLGKDGEIPWLIVNHGEVP